MPEHNETRLWILEPQEGYGDRFSKGKPDNPWDPPWDCTCGLVVEAKSEDEARALAHDAKGDEGRGGHPDVWLDDRYTSCAPLATTGESRIVMIDFHAG